MINKVSDFKQVNLSNIPEELTTFPQWVAWKSEYKDNGKVNKIPVDPHTGSYASTNKPETWGAYEEAVAYYNKMNGAKHCWDWIRVYKG